MKKIVTLICVCLTICIFGYFSTKADPLISINITNDVVGKRGKTISEIEVELTFNEPEEYFFNVDNIFEYDEITSWFTNIPVGCNYYVEVKSVTPTTLIASFSGSIDANAPLTEGTPITLCIPYTEGDEKIMAGVNYYMADLSDVNNVNASYIVEDDVFEIEYYGPYTVSGTVGKDIVSQDVVVHIKNRGPANIDFDPLSLLQSLAIENGLTPTITSFDDTLDLITITYTGIPLAKSKEEIHTTFPSSYMVNASEDIVVPDRQDVHFDINEEGKPNVTPYIAPYTGVR